MADTQVLIVGAGGGGPVVAKEVAERGVKVTMLEAGPWLDPDRDFSLVEDDMRSIVDGVLRWGPADRAKAPWVRRRDGVGLILQAAGVGGTTLHYNGICPRIYPSALTDAWPLSWADLVPWYERVEEFLPVSLVEDLATKDALFAAGCEAVGLKRSETKEVREEMWRPCHNAILPIAKMTPGGSLRHPDVRGCTMCGHCLEGCPHPAGAPIEEKAKRATNVSYVPAAVATGNCTIFPNAFATKILFESGNGRGARAVGVRWRDTKTGEERESTAEVVVLAGGSIESPRLWLNSGLPNTHDAVGRYLTTHLQDFVTGIFDRKVNPNVGQVTMARADFPGYGTMWSQGFGPQSYAIVLTGGTGWWESTPEGPFDLRGRTWGAEALRKIDTYSRSLTIALSVDDEEEPHNRITLADDWPADEHGAVPKVTYHPSTVSRDRQSWLAAKAAEVLRAAGAKEVHRTDIQPAFFTHIMGTMRIGRDPATSVADPGGEAHEVERLFIGDSSALPNGIGGPNPTLTAQALAARTAGEIANRYLA